MRWKIYDNGVSEHNDGPTERMVAATTELRAAVAVLAAVGDTDWTIRIYSDGGLVTVFTEGRVEGFDAFISIDNVVHWITHKMRQSSPT